MSNQIRKYLWSLFYARFFTALVSIRPHIIKEQYLKDLKLFFQIASIEEIELLINAYNKEKNQKNMVRR